MGRRERELVARLHHLSKTGWEVRVEHEHRYYIPAQEHYATEPIAIVAPVVLRPSETGGRTKVTLTPPKGTWTGIQPDGVTGEARCRPDERFDKRLGFVIAAGRALHELDEEIPF